MNNRLVVTREKGQGGEGKMSRVDQVLYGDK